MTEYRFERFKRPEEANVEYGVEWAADLKTGETIVTSEFTGDGVTVDDTDLDGTTATTIAYLSGGIGGTTASVTNTIVTSAGQTLSRQVLLKIQ